MNRLKTVSLVIMIGVIALAALLFTCNVRASSMVEESVSIPFTGNFSYIQVPLGSQIIDVRAVGEAPNQTMSVFYESTGSYETEVKMVLVIPKGQQRPTHRNYRSIRLGCFDFNGLDGYGFQYNGEACAYEYVPRY